MINPDTNVLLRFLVSDDDAQAVAARRFVERELSPTTQGHVSLIALAELVWTLQSRYEVLAEEVERFLRLLLVSPHFLVERADVVQAVLANRPGPAADFADALIAALGAAAGCTETVTFDRRFARQKGVRLLR